MLSTHFFWHHPTYFPVLTYVDLVGSKEQASREWEMEGSDSVVASKKRSFQKCNKEWSTYHFLGWIVALLLADKLV